MSQRADSQHKGKNVKQFDHNLGLAFSRKSSYCLCFLLFYLLQQMKNNKMYFTQSSLYLKGGGHFKVTRFHNSQIRNPGEICVIRINKSFFLLVFPSTWKGKSSTFSFQLTIEITLLNCILLESQYCF